MKKKLQVYIVDFCTGEYEDRRDRIAGIFSSESKAKSFATKMRKELDALGLHWDGDNSKCHDYDLRYSEDVQTKFGLSIDYTGAGYAIHGPYNVN